MTGYLKMAGFPALAIIAMGLMAHILPLPSSSQTIPTNQDKAGAFRTFLPEIQNTPSELSEAVLFGRQDVVSSLEYPVPEAGAAVSEDADWYGSGYALVGIVSQDKKKTAYFSNRDGSDRLAVYRGHEIAGWQVKHIYETRIELTRNSQRLWVELFQAQGGPE